MKDVAVTPRPPAPGPALAPNGLTLLLGLYAAALVLALYPFTENPAAPIKLLLSAGVFVITAVALSFRLLRSDRAVPIHGLLFILALWLGYQYASTVWSSTPQAARAFLVLWAVGAGLGLVLYLSAGDSRLFDRLAIGFTGAVSLAALYGFLQGLGLDPFPWSLTEVEEYRGLPATYGNPNFAGHTLVISIVLLVAFLWHRIETNTTFSIPSAIAVALLLIQGAHLWLTHMRGGLVALLAVAIFAPLCAALAHFAWPPRRKALALLLLLLAGAATAFAGAIALLLRLPQISDTSLLVRLNSYLTALRMVGERPLFGWGADAFAIHSPPYWSAFEADWFAYQGKFNSHVHNELLEFAVDGGGVGAFLFILLALGGIFIALQRSFEGDQDAWRARAVALALVAFVVDGFFGFNLRVPVSGILFFLLIGAAAALDRKRRFFQVNGRVFAGLMLLGAAATAWSATGQFLGERAYQAGKGAWGHALARANTGDSEGANRLAVAADTLLNRAHRWLPGDERPLLQRATIARNTAQWASASQGYNEALQKTPYDPRVLTAMAETAITGTENPEEALAAAQPYLDTAETLTPHYAPIFGLRGKALARAAAEQEDPRTWTGAAMAYENAIRYSPVPRHDWALGLVEARYFSGEHAGLVDLLRRTATQHPSNPELWRLADLLALDPAFQADMVDLAVHHLGQAQQEDFAALLPADRFGFSRALPRMAGLLADFGASRGVDPNTQQILIRGALVLQYADQSLWGSYARVLPGEAAEASLLAVYEEIVQANPNAPALVPPVVGTLLDLLRNPVGKATNFASQITSALDRLPQEDGYRNNRRTWAWLVPWLQTVQHYPAHNEIDKLYLESTVGALWAATGEWHAGADTLAPIAGRIIPQFRGVAYYDLARCQEGTGDLSSARTSAEEARRRLPNEAQVGWYAANLDIAVGQAERGMNTLETLIPTMEPGTRLYALALESYCRGCVATSCSDALGVCP